MKLEINIYKVFTLLLIFFSGVMFLLSFFSMFYNKSIFLEWEVFYYSSSSFVMSLIFDWMSFMFLGAVSFISGCIMKYSYYYMEGEVNFLRFVIILLLFVGSMMIVIISPNLISLLLGWDGLGLSSYILVVFYQNESSANAGMLTVLSNRVGDVMILMSAGLLGGLGSWNYYMFEMVDTSLVVLVILLAGMTKSAQMPFSAWLPAAMAAPTPVSSLVHSSTLVTAGVYLLIRFYPVMSSMCYLWGGLLAISAMTMVFAGLGANFETDMKKVVALSTLSQLGLMMMILSVGLVSLSFFHLITHAMFKSSLFMCVGFMMHNLGGNQDGRSMSGFSQMSPLMASYFLIVNMALMGFPFLAGFYSKDLILESMFMSSESYLMMAVLVFGTGLTFSYSLRIMFLASGSSITGPSLICTSDMDKSVASSVAGLAAASVIVGFICSWLCFSEIEAVSLMEWEKYMVIMIGVVSGGSIYLFMKKDFRFKDKFLSVSMASSMGYLPEVSSNFMSKPFFVLGGVCDKYLDKGWLEFYGGKGGENFFMGASNKLQEGQNSVMVSGYLISVVCLLSMILSVF
uniref:NADH-ubiquinone oxidoreductase chain 5 n=1 Tax=Pseudoniphargus sp. 2-Andalusia TaxID=2212669 RepID=A0A345UE74_9CRUS|nr:NADH dehydrogenase subunit 5 [Pseudoniphargus sp. 2-Andalusia]